MFTLNNYTEEEESRLQGLVSSGQVSYILFGHEVGEQGTPHLQGYLEVPTKRTHSSIKSIVSRRAHIEKANGSLQSNQNYCTKEDANAFSAGTPMRQGHRSDLDEIKERIDQGATDLEIAENFFAQWCQYGRPFKRYRAMKAVTRTWPTITHVYWGKTGTGKTRFVMDQVMDSTFWSPGDYQWFDGYEGQDIIIIDDYRGEYKLQMLLKLLDRYPMQVPVKGGFTNWAPKKVYITSNIRPRSWYQEADNFSLAALFRRINLIEAVFEPLYPDIIQE